MSTSTRIIKNTGFLYAKMGITMFISLWTTRLVLNSLGASDFGIFSIVGGAIGMLGFLNSTMASATQRFMSYTKGAEDMEKCKEIFNISIVLHFATALLLVLSLAIAGYFFFNGVLTIPSGREYAAQIVYGSLIVSTAFTVMSVPYDATLNAHENMKYYAIVGILESLLKLGVAFVCVYAFTDKLILYGVLMACIPLFTLTIMRVYCHKHYEECKLAPLRYWDKNTAKEIMGFAGWNFSGSMTSIIGNYGNGLVMNHFYGPILNAAIGIANQMNGQLLVFSNSMQKAVNPVITKSEGAGKRQYMLEVATTSCKLSFAALAIFAIPFIIEMPYIQKIWLKNVPQWAVIFTQLQIVRTLMELLTLPYGQAIASEGRIAKYNLFLSILNITPVICLYILFSLGYSPIFMYILNISIFGVLLSLVKVYFVHKNCGLPYYIFYKEILIKISGSFILPFCIALLPHLFIEEGFVRFMITLIFGAGSYVLFFIIFALNYKERNIITQNFKKLQTKIIKTK